MRNLKKSGMLSRALARLTILEQQNLIAAIRSIYGCRVTVWDWNMYERSLAGMTNDEQAAAIEWVMRIWC